jgi:hypothetical protein
MIKLLICYLLGTIFLWADLSHWSLIFSAPSLSENWCVVTSPLTHHQTWWTSVSDRATDGLEITDRTPPFESNWSTIFNRICFIFMCGFLLHWCRRVGDVFNTKRSPCDFIFYLLYVEISLVDNWTSLNRKNPSYLVLSCHDFHPLLVNDDLNGRGADCVHLQA